MKVHEGFPVKRSEDVAHEADYRKYLPRLREDFNHRCGYCGKPEYATTTGFEIDHFVPLDIDENKKTQYTNLVYSCFTCNRKKGNKWPTKDTDSCHDGKEGFVDPCADEYDMHLERMESGEIRGITDVGKYMCEVAFKFHMRPIEEIWKIARLHELKERIYEKRSELSKEQLLEYIEIDKIISELMDYMFPRRE